MKAILENSSPEIIVGLNSEFLGNYRKLTYKYNQGIKYFKDFNETDSNRIYVLKLLDGKWGNFCYLLDEFLAVSVAQYAKFPSGKGIDIHLYRDNSSYYQSHAFNLLFNFNHERDSLERSSSAFARSVVKKIASFKKFSEAYHYLSDVQKSRREFNVL